MISIVEKVKTSKQITIDDKIEILDIDYEILSCGHMNNLKLVGVERTSGICPKGCK